MAPKYRPGALDADGRYYLTAAAGNVLGCRVGQASGAWASPTTANRCGAARDGYYYQNGVLCGEGSFGTMVDGIAQERWGSMDSLMTMTRHWPIFMDNAITEDGGHNNPVMQADGVVRLSGPATVLQKKTDVLCSCFRWMLQGDFDIILHTDDLRQTSSWCSDAIALVVWSSFMGTFFTSLCSYSKVPSTYIYTRRTDDGAATVVYTSANLGSVPASCKLRITRVENLFSAYWDIGAGWVASGTYTATKELMQPLMFVEANLGTHPGYWGSGADTVEPRCDVQWELVNGTVVNRPSWALMTPDANRGSRPDFPENHLLVWTAKEVSIIDLDNDKLWMRLINPQAIAPWAATGAKYVLPGSLTAVIADSWMDNDLGILYVVITGAGSNTSCVIEINFGTGVARSFSYDTSMAGCPCPGGTFNHSLGSAFNAALNQGDQTTIGFSAPNNQGKSWGSNYGSVKDASFWLSDGNCYQTHTWIEGSYTYKAFAYVYGCQVFKWRTYNTSDAPVMINIKRTTGTDVLAVRFAADGTLVFADANGIYVTSKATWQAAMGTGIFVEDAALFQPGTVSNSCQYALSASASGIYLCRDEGVYFVTWADALAGGAAFTLKFSSPGGGGTYEVLPAYIAVRAMSIMSIGIIDVALIATTEAGPSYWVHAIRLDTAELVGSGEATDLDAAAIALQGAI